VNKGWALVDVSGTGYDLLSVFLHELGHMLGLAHVNDVNEIMNPFGQGKTTLGLGDQEGLWRLGTSQSCFPSALLA
jgi:predicted Zn-dependent protease